MIDKSPCMVFLNGLVHEGYMGIKKEIGVYILCDASMYKPLGSISRRAKVTCLLCIGRAFFCARGGIPAHEWVEAHHV